MCKLHGTPLCRGEGPTAEEKRQREFVALSKQLYKTDAKFYAVVQNLATMIFDGDVTATEMVCALPLAIVLAEEQARLRDFRHGGTHVYYQGDKPG